MRTLNRAERSHGYEMPDHETVAPLLSILKSYIIVADELRTLLMKTAKHQQSVLVLGAMMMAGVVGAQQVPAKLGAALVFDGTTVVDVRDGTLHPEQRVVVVGTRIREVGPADRVQAPANARVVEARGTYMIPGLWDMHFHTNGQPPKPFDALLIANGITGIRDPAPGDSIATQRHWRAEIAAGTRVGPRRIVTGPMLESYDEPAVERFSTRRRPGKIIPWSTRKARRPDEARRLVDSLAGAGAEFIKTHWDLLPRETYYTIAAAARRVGLPLEGHVPATISVLEAAESGHRIMDHVVQITIWGRFQGSCQGAAATLERCRALARRLRERDAWLVVGPTRVGQPRIRSRLPYLSDSSVVDYSDHPAMQEFRSAVALMHHAGMPLLVGSDAGGAVGMLPWSLMHEELEFAVRAGATPLEALQTATLNPAKYLKGTDSLGTVEQGKLADLVLLDANPLADITNTAKIRAVVANGRFFDRNALDALLADVESAVTEIRQAGQ